MNILESELLIVISFIINLFLSVALIFKAKKTGRTKQAVIGAGMGFIIAIGLIFAGMVVVFISMLLVEYSIETALSLLMSIALLAMPTGVFIASKVK